MKKGIKTSLYLPKECLDILLDRKEEVINYLNTEFENLNYDIYLGEYQDQEVCSIDITLVNKTFSLINEEYKTLKMYLKKVTGKQPKQRIMIKYHGII